MHLFVYGTLMEGFANHHVLATLGATKITRARTVAPRTLLDLGPYPALLASDKARDAGAARVAGEVFALTEDGLAVVDRFEGAPELYRREEIDLETERGEHVRAFTYVLAWRPPARARVVATGAYDQRGRPLERGVTAEQLADEDATSSAQSAGSGSGGGTESSAGGGAGVAGTGAETAAAAGDTEGGDAAAGTRAAAADEA